VVPLGFNCGTLDGMHASSPARLCSPACVSSVAVRLRMLASYILCTARSSVHDKENKAC
jgi:hypothetical protein